jgi:hypothetical protein
MTKPRAQLEKEIHNTYTKEEERVRKILKP